MLKFLFISQRIFCKNNFIFSSKQPFVRLRLPERQAFRALNIENFHLLASKREFSIQTKDSFGRYGEATNQVTAFAVSSLQVDLEYVNTEQ